MTKTKKPTRAELERKIAELKACLIHQYHFADAALAAIKPGHFLASGVIISITALGGREIIPPVMIKDGLSADTIMMLRRDLVRSYEDAVMFKPKGSEV